MSGFAFLGVAVVAPVDAHGAGREHQRGGDQGRRK